MTVHERYDRAEQLCTEASYAIMRAQLAGESEEVVNGLRSQHRTLELAAQCLAEQCGAARRASEGE